MARNTAAQLRARSSARKADRVVDLILDEASRVSLYGETEFAVPPAHDYNRLSESEKAEVKATFEALGYKFELRIALENLRYMVLTW